MLVVVLLWAWARGRETRASLADRLALAQEPAAATPHIWLHGASVGELRAARHLIDTLLAQSGHNIILTANTKSGVEMAQSWALDKLTVRFSPADAFGAAPRFLRHWHVAAQITLENELWPNRIRACTAKQVPVFGVSTRLPSAVSEGGIVARIAKSVLGSYHRIWPQHEAAADALKALIDPGKIADPYNAKATLPIEPPAPDRSHFLAAWQGKDIVLAASTHAPEERLMAEAYTDAIKAHPDLRMIIAPRHPDRGPRIARSLEMYDFSMSCRSEGEGVSPETQVYLADTMGEMNLWYSQAPRTIIGGTFAPKGGHTPIEPILAGSFPLHGPDVANHQSSFDALDRKGGAQLLADQAALVWALSQPADGAEIGRGLQAATDVVGELSRISRAMTQEITTHVTDALND